MKADGPRAVEVEERPRQQVLAVVLLAVVAAPRLVHAAVHALPVERRVEDVEDVGAGVEDSHDAHVVEGAGVPGLSAALRIEGRAVQDDGGPAFVLSAADDRRVELEEVGVVAVEALGHRGCGERFTPAPDSPESMRTSGGSKSPLACAEPRQGRAARRQVYPTPVVAIPWLPWADVGTACREATRLCGFVLRGSGDSP
jgi:hypothetical protein